MQIDLTYGEDQANGEEALFIDAKHFPSEWELDKEVRDFLKGKTEVIYFVIIDDDGTEGNHGYIENGEIIQWG